MKQTRNILLRLLLTPMLVFATGTLFAQYEDDQTGYDNYYGTDSTMMDSTYDENYDYGDYEDPDATEKPKKEKKPYVRITMPYDTITELISYTGVVEQEDSYYDSLYLRAQKFMMAKFKLTEKDFKISKKEMNKIVMTVNMPFKVQTNKFVTAENGTLEFKVSLWFKDGKYKYEIDHLKHQMPVNASGNKGVEYVYLEYYMKSEKNIVANDKLLRAADQQINTVIKEMQKALREPARREEDEFDF